MNKKEFKEMWDWLLNNTNNFTPRKDSYEQVWSCIERTKYYAFDIPMKTFLNLYQNHYLINGNKRIAFASFWFLSDDIDWKDFKHHLIFLGNE